MASLFSFLPRNMAPALLSPHPFYLVLLLLLPCTIAQTSQEIPLGSSLIADDQNTSWASPSSEFAFGFFRLPRDDRFLLAIWFNKTPDRTVVWSANRDHPVQRGSKVSLTNDGRLVLVDHLDQEKWSRPKSIDERAASASMLDKGNFVLLGKNTNSPNIWESFLEPTDTILPSQTLSKPSKLSSRKTETDYSMGRFQLRLQTDGNLVLYTVAQPTEFPYDAYWSSNTVGSGSQVVFNESGYNIIFIESLTSGYVSLTQSNGNATINLTPGDIISTENFYHRLTVDFDGVLRQYVYPKSSQSSWAQSWSVVWFEPPDMCSDVIYWQGSGPCGYNSYCRMDINQKPTCECPPGYSLVDPNNTFGDCKKEFVPQSCEQGGLREESQFELTEMRNVDWPLADYEMYQPINEDLCRQVCLEDCFCDVAVFNGDICWKKKMPLSNGRLGPGVSRKTFIKVPKINSSIQSPTASCRSKRDRAALIIAGSVLIGSSGILNVLIVLTVSSALFYAYRRRKSITGGDNTSMLGKRIRLFTYSELERATDRFKEELGRGAFGAVYKGVLSWDSRHVVAVKKLDGVALVGEADREFKTEVIAIGQTHHKNLARLLGFCNEGPHRLLVFEFMSNGSLASFLFGSMKPDWNQRVQIALGVARGLVYLHEECSTQIIHCDITPQNILLDESFTPRISDFGLAKLMKADQTRSITSIRGTRGYVAPEWFRNMPITTKVDVYSFGVLLLEIICCRQNVEMGLENEERMILTDWAYDCFAEKRMNLLVDNDEDALNDTKRVERLIMVAIWCIQEDPKMRPSMEKVAEMLEGAVEVHSPPSPCLLSSFTR